MIRPTHRSWNISFVNDRFLLAGCSQIKRSRKSSEEKSCLFAVGDKTFFHLESEYIIWRFLFKNLYSKQSLSVIMVLMKTLKYRNRFFLFLTTILQNVSYQFKASWLLSTLLSLLPNVHSSLAWKNMIPFVVVERTNDGLEMNWWSPCT